MKDENAPSGAARGGLVYEEIRRIYRESLLPGTATYIGYCCREWVMAYGYPAGRCGYCGERPTYLREDE
jgi:hypothetical protein